MATTDLDLGRYQLGWSDAEDYVFKPKKGLNESIVREMSEMKNEPQWMRDFRLRALKHFERKPMAPWFATQMPNLDFDDIFYYIKPTGGQVDKWEDLPDAIKNTYEKLGIPEAERKYLSGVTAQYESEVVFHRNREDLEEQGVLFCDMDTAVREYPEHRAEVVRQDHPAQRQQVRRPQLGRVVGWLLHLRPAGREGGHAAAGVLPDQRREHGPVRAHADHRRRRLPGALHRGCSAPVYSTDSLHSASSSSCFAGHASLQPFRTVTNVYNLSLSGLAEAEAHVEWITQYRSHYHEVPSYYPTADLPRR